MRYISSFDIFDTCLVRKCGTPENSFDVLSLHAFRGDVTENERQEFVAARHIAQQKSGEQTPYYTLHDIWDNYDWSHQFLKSKKELCQLEKDLEREMLVPVLSMRDKVNECRKRGDKIIFISDMYLSSDFLIDILRSYGFYQDGEALYVSCECSALKWNGELFEYVRKQENIPSFRHWHHYGDNEQGDYKAPKKLGIKCTLLNHAYTPYQQQWVDNDYVLGFKYPSILAGLGRALHYSTEWNTHTDFVLDIIAPFYSSLVYRMMKDAEQRGFKRLYFCARDAWPLYRIAERFSPLFPSIESKYLYISRQALYEGEDEAKICYFQQMGLATRGKDVAIVDVRSQGKTQRFLSDYFKEKGYEEVFGYYFEMFTKLELKYLNSYRSEVNKIYLTAQSKRNTMLSHWEIYEDFFSLNDFPKTVDYQKDKDGMAKPLFSYEKEQQDSFTKDQTYWMHKHEELLDLYAQNLVQLGECHYLDKIFEQVAMPTLIRFMEYPDSHYLHALSDFYAYNEIEKRYVPYVKRLSLKELIIKRGRCGNKWRRASLIYTLPKWLINVLYNKRH